jgi:UDP-N-acetylmuramate--alanine ligase
MKIDLLIQNITNIHFVGIGGISLSALAKLMRFYGKNVTGSDLKASHLTRELALLGIKVFIKHNKKNLKMADLIVFSGAVPANNSELIKAKKLKIPILERADFVGLITKEYNQVIAVSGSHGKTTTCGMLASIFIEAGLKPTVHIGGESKTTNGNMLIGEKDFFITEACEYKNSYLKFGQHLGVILNIENDHTDYFKDVNDVYSSFSQFYNLSKKVNVISQNYVDLINVKEKKHITFNIEADADYVAKDIKLNKNFHTTFTVFKKSKSLGKFEITSPLKHNVYNALASIATAIYYNVPPNKIKTGLKKFEGIKRRFEYIGKIENSIIIHDYAHHPTEIMSTISSCKDIYNMPITAVFQPHTYTRTKTLMSEFLKCFNEVSKIIIAKTYAAREKPLKEGSAQSLAINLKKEGKRVNYFNNFKKIKKHLLKTTQKNQIILVLGAGDIEDLAHMLLN